VLGDNRNESLDSRVWDNGKPSGVSPFRISMGRVTLRLSDVRRDQTPHLRSLFFSAWNSNDSRFKVWTRPSFKRRRRALSSVTAQ